MEGSELGLLHLEHFLCNFAHMDIRSRSAFIKIFMVEFILRTNLRQQLRASRSSGTRVSPFICFQLDRQRECLSFRDLWLDKWAAL